MGFAHRVVVCGKTQSGKTTGAKGLAAQIAGPRLDVVKTIIFDPVESRDNWSPLGAHVCYSRREYLQALASWEEQRDRAPIVVRAEFLDWSPLQRMAGPSLVIVDEASRYCSPTSIDRSWRDILSTGRHYGIHTITCTHSPSELHPAAWGGLTLALVYTLTHRAHKRAAAEHLGLPRSHAWTWRPVPNHPTAVYPLVVNDRGEILSGQPSGEPAAEGDER